MNRTTSAGVVATVVAVLLAAIAAAALAFGALNAPGADPSPSTPASPAPPTAKPSAIPSVPPSPSAPVDGDYQVDLDVVTPHEVSVVIADGTGMVTGATSGRAGDGMSVRWFDARVENVDADTLRVTWVGLPVDARIRLAISEADGTVRLAFVQPAPPKDSDAVGFDRVLVLDFAEAVDADDVRTTFTEAASSEG